MPEPKKPVMMVTGTGGGLVIAGEAGEEVGWHSGGW